MLKVSRECEAAIRQLAPKYIAVPDAPNSAVELQAWMLSHQYLRDALPVYDGNCENTIFSSPEINHAFRAWHDAVHLEHNLGFGFKDELKVARLHIAELRLLGITGLDADLVFNDVAGQIIFFYWKKEYVKDQQKFHQHLFINGMEAIWTYEQ